MSKVDWRAEARRYAVPALVLLVATAGALVVRAATTEDAPAAPAKARAKAPPAQAPVKVKRGVARLHIVSSGDTLGGIAERYDTTVERLQALNPKVDPQALRVGQELRVPAGGG